MNSVIHLLNNWGLSGEFVCGYWGVKGLLCIPQTLKYSSLHFFIDLGSSKLTYGPFLHSAQVSKHKEKWGWSLGWQLHTNRCILSSQASSCYLCFQECRKGLFVCTSMYCFPCSVPHGVFFFYQDIFPDKASERRILSYLVRCPCPGCQWMGELREVQVKVMLISGLDSPIFLVRIPL